MFQTDILKRIRKKHYYRKTQRVSMCWGGRHDPKPPLITPYSAIMCPIRFGECSPCQMRNAILQAAPCAAVQWALMWNDDPEGKQVFGS